MKSTAKLIDNLINDEFRKCKVDLQKAQEHIMKVRVNEKKNEIIEKMNK
jgi:hypothetical protein